MAGNSRPKLTDVAREAGVSIGTVSRVLNDEPSVNEDLRVAVLAAVERLSYRPNPIARALRAGRSNTIGISVRTLRTLSVEDFTAGASEVLQAAGYTVLVSESSQQPAVERASVYSLQMQHFDAVVGLNPHSMAPFHETAAAGIPTVIVGRRASGNSLASVPIDNRTAAQALMDDFAAQGHRVVAQVTFELEGRSVPLQYTSHVREGRMDLRLVPNARRVRWEQADLQAVLENGVTALVLRSDIGAQVLAAVKRAGLVIPRDLSVAVWGQSVWSEIHSPGLNALELDYMPVGRSAARQALALIGGSTTESPEVFCYTYASRGSIGPVPPTAPILSISRAADQQR